MNKRKYSMMDKVLSYILLVLAVFGCTLGLLIVTSTIKLVDSFPISSSRFGFYLIIISLFCFIYSIIIIVLSNKQLKRK